MYRMITNNPHVTNFTLATTGSIDILVVVIGSQARDFLVFSISWKDKYLQKLLHQMISNKLYVKPQSPSY